MQPGGYFGVILWAEVKLGEMLETTVGRGGKSDRSTRGGTSKPLPHNIDKKQSHYAQQLSKHPDVVEEVKQNQGPTMLL